MSVNWSYYDNEKFDKLDEKYLPCSGEGETKATQIVTCVNKLIYKWYNDGDVFDNTRHLKGWMNDLSSYANWLYYYVDEETQKILDKVYDCCNDSDYEDLLKELADKLLDEEFLEKQDKIGKMFTIYDCDGKFKFVELEEDEYEDEWYEEDEEENEDEWY